MIIVTGVKRGSGQVVSCAFVHHYARGQRQGICRVLSAYSADHPKRMRSPTSIARRQFPGRLRSAQKKQHPESAVDSAPPQRSTNTCWHVFARVREDTIAASAEAKWRREHAEVSGRQRGEVPQGTRLLLGLRICRGVGTSRSRAFEAAPRKSTRWRFSAIDDATATGSRVRAKGRGPPAASRRRQRRASPEPSSLAPQAASARC